MGNGRGLDPAPTVPTTAGGVTGRPGTIGWARSRLRVGERDGRTVPPFVRRLGVLWVGVSATFTTVTATFVDSRDAYVFVLVFMACGAYTAPGLVAAWYATRRAPAADRAIYQLLTAGLAGIIVIGVGMLVGLATGWRWGNVLGPPAVALDGLLFTAGLMLLVRSRSGRRALLVDIVECLAAVVAVVAPLAVLWWPAVIGADESWFTVPCALIVVPLVGGTYWMMAVFARQGPGWSLFETFTVVLGIGGVVDVGLQTAQGVSGFSLPAPPLIALNALCVSMFWLIPLHIPYTLRPGLDRLSPQAQVRDGWLALSVTLAGTTALVITTVSVADERPWTVPFAFGVVTLLLVLAGIQHVAALRETRRLYRRVEEVADERRLLLAQVLERSGHDRRRFAGQLHEQALASYASFTALTAGSGESTSRARVAAAATTAAQDNMARHARSLRELLTALRPVEDDRRDAEGVRTPIAAYLASVYGDRPVPRLGVSTAEAVTLDWVTETVLLQIVQEALHNVWRHSGATAVDVTLDATDGVLGIRVADDGAGFDTNLPVAESGIAAMRALAGVLGGQLTVASQPGRGTVVTARLAGDAQPPPGSATAPAPGSRGDLRLVRDAGGDDAGDDDPGGSPPAPR